jgi:phage gp29-like protein
VIAWKFGQSAPVLVELKLRTKTRDNLVQDITVIEKAKGFGVRISPSWFTAKFGIVEADTDERALGEAAAGVTPPPAPTTAAINSATSFRDWVASVQDPQAATLFDELAAAAQDPRMSDADFLKLAQESVAVLSEIDPDAAADFSAALEAEMLKKAANTLSKS